MAEASNAITSRTMRDGVLGGIGEFRKTDSSTGLINSSPIVKILPRGLKPISARELLIKSCILALSF